MTINDRFEAGIDNQLYTNVDRMTTENTSPLFKQEAKVTLV